MPLLPYSTETRTNNRRFIQLNVPITNLEPQHTLYSVIDNIGEEARGNTDSSYVNHVIEDLAYYIRKKPKLRHSYILVMALTHIQRYPCCFENIVATRDITWHHEGDSVEFRVILFESGFINFGVEHDQTRNWGWTPGKLCHLPDFENQHEHGRMGYLVWANFTSIVGGSTGNTKYATYFHRRPIKQITITTDFWAEVRATVVTSLIFEYEDGAVEQLGSKHGYEFVIPFFPNEQIFGVSVRTGSYVYSIQLHICDTSLNEMTSRHTRWLGDSAGEIHDFLQMPKGIYGNCGQCIDSIGIMF